MVLYKYMQLDSALKLLSSATLGFTQVSALNDPSESSASAHPGDAQHIYRGYDRRHAIAANYGVLSLTRNPLSPIMWSHYGKNHTGMVIGIELDATDLNDETQCVLPAKYGSVIYTLSKPGHAYRGSTDDIVRGGQLQEFAPDYLEALQRMFLYKSAEWHYEEEVRVVKRTDAIKAAGGTVLPGELWAYGGTTHLLPIRREAIAEVYMGFRSAHDRHSSMHLLRQITAHLSPTTKLFNCWFESNTWGMAGAHIENWTDAPAEDGD